MFSKFLKLLDARVLQTASYAILKWSHLPEIMENSTSHTLLDCESLSLLQESLSKLENGFSALPFFVPWEPSEPAAMRVALQVAAEKLHDNFPYFHPLYAGQMLKPPHPVARAAYGLAMWINPNNHARDGGRASSQMEIEAVRELAAMCDWTTHLGHLTSGGTFANLEALWVAGRICPGNTILASSQAHYTHQRISGVLQLAFDSVATDARGRMCPEALEKRLQQGDVGTVVVTLGTTALGAVDPLADIVALRRRYGFRVHVDAAYGGYFRLASNLGAEANAAYAALPEADSIVIDPHKHGLQPYGCGCILFQDPSVGRFYKHDSPYTYFTSDDLHLGEISLECSRAGAAAVALWTTQRLLPLKRHGRFAAMLESCRSAAMELYSRLSASSAFVVPMQPQLDIVVWAVRGATVEASSARAQEIFRAAARRDLHLALVQLPQDLFPDGTWAESHSDSAAKISVTCLRSVLMKPEHLQWLDAIWERLQSATEEVCAGQKPEQA